MESTFRLITGLDTTPLAAAAGFALEESEPSPPPSPRPGSKAAEEESPRGAVVALPPRWEEAEQCRLCHKQFGPFTREHHCRRCGAAVCNACSPQRLRLPQLGITDRVRVCVPCAREEKSQAEEETVETGSTIACYADVVPVVDRVAMTWKDLQPTEGDVEEVELGSVSPLCSAKSDRRPTVRVQVERSTDGTWGVNVDDSGSVTEVREPDGARNALSPGVRITAVDGEPVDTGAEVLAALARNQDREVVLTVATTTRDAAGNLLAQSGDQTTAPPPPLLPTLRVQQASALASLPMLGEDARRYRIVCEMPPTDDNPLAVTYWVAASDDETQARTIFRECVEDCLQPLLSPVITHLVCHDCSAFSPTFNLPDQTVGRWCKNCATLNHRGATNVVCHAVWLRELKRLVMQRRVVKSSRRRPYNAYLRLQPGFASSVEESHSSLEPGVYTFQLWFDKSQGASLLFSLSLLLNQQQAEPPPSEGDDTSAASQREPVARQSIFIQNEPIGAETEQRFRLVVPAEWRGQLNASYRTSTPALVNVRHKFAMDAGSIPRSQITGVRPRYLDADGNLRRVRILSMDGGGVRGTAEAMILMEILKHTAMHGTTKKVHEQFDLICGTSTGGLFALALGAHNDLHLHFWIRGVDPADLKKLWGEKAGKIFSREWNFMGKKITEETQKFGDVHLGLLSDRLKYDHKNLEGQINEFFEGEFMDTQKWLKEKTAKVCVVSHLLDVVPLTPYVMRSYELPQEVTNEVGKVSGASPFAIGDWRLSCLEAGRATSAAPTYFEPMTVWRTWESRLLIGNDTVSEERQTIEMGETAMEPVEELVATPTHEDVLAELGLVESQIDRREVAPADQARQLQQHRLQMLQSCEQMTGQATTNGEANVGPAKSSPTEVGNLARTGSTRRVVQMRRRSESEVVALRINLQKKYSLSTIVRFENRTALTVSKIKADLVTGVWEPGWMPPNTVGPFEEVAQVGTNSSSSAIASSANQTITIEWDNPWVLRPPAEDIRKFEAIVSSRRDLIASVHTFDTDGDRATNPLELRCLVERMGESRAYSVVEDPAHFNHDQDGGPEQRVGEARIEGFLEKKQPPPGFRWQPRWFHLGVDGTLRYFVTTQDSDGDQIQELKGVMHMRNVSSIEPAVGHETDFMIEHLEKPRKRQYHLRAASEELRNRWLATLREGWTPAVVPQTGMGFEADEDGRSTEARRYKSMRFSDGGTVANNPTFIALLEAWALYGAPGSSLHDFVGRSLTSQQIGITNIWKRHCSEQDCVVSVGTGDPPPRQLRDGMGFKELVWEVLEHHTTSRDTDVFLSQMLPKNRYYRFNAPDIGAIQLDETDRQQLDILQNKVELYLQMPETQEKLKQLGGLLHECGQRPPGSARAADADQIDMETTCPGPTPYPSPTIDAAAGTGTAARGNPVVGTTGGQTKMLSSQTEIEILLQQAIEAKQQLEARIAELRAASR